MSNTLKVYGRVLQIKDVLEELGDETTKLTKRQCLEIYTKLGEIKFILLGERRER